MATRLFFCCCYGKKSKKTENATKATRQITAMPSCTQIDTVDESSERSDEEITTVFDQYDARKERSVMVVNADTQTLPRQRNNKKRGQLSDKSAGLCTD